MLLSRFPRVSLAHLPTPLEALPRLSKHLGGPDIYVKRDDCTGLGSGGNKTRKLEFLMAEALQRKATVVITQGAVQSNHARQTAAAACKLAMKCELVFERRIDRPSDPYLNSGNVFLDRIYGAGIREVDKGSDMTAALVMIGSYARRLWAPDYPWGPTIEERDRFCRTIIEQWGGPVGIDERAPSRALDPEFRNWWSAYLRMGASPGAAVALTRMNAEVDIRHVLPHVRVPALVVHRTGDRCLKIEEGRYLAEHIPGATMVELPGNDHLPFVGDQLAMLSAIDQFLKQL